MAAIIELQKNITDNNRMLLHNIRGKAGNLVKEIIEPKMFNGENDVTLTIEQFTKLRLFLANLSHHGSLGEIDSPYMQRYIDDSVEKEKILNLLLKDE